MALPFVCFTFPRPGTGTRPPPGWAGFTQICWNDDTRGRLWEILAQNSPNLLFGSLLHCFEIIESQRSQTMTYVRWMSDWAGDASRVHRPSLEQAGMLLSTTCRQTCPILSWQCILRADNIDAWRGEPQRCLCIFRVSGIIWSSVANVEFFCLRSHLFLN